MRTATAQISAAKLAEARDRALRLLGDAEVEIAGMSRLDLVATAIVLDHRESYREVKTARRRSADLLDEVARLRVVVLQFVALEERARSEGQILVEEYDGVLERAREVLARRSR